MGGGTHRVRSDIQRQVVDQPAHLSLADRVTDNVTATFEIAEQLVVHAVGPTDDRLFGGKFSTWDWWARRNTALIEIDRLEVAQRRYKNHHLDWDVLWEDIRLLHAVIADVDHTVRSAIETALPLSDQELDWLVTRHAIFVQALSVLAIHNDSHEQSMREGILLACASIPWIVLEVWARSLTEAIENLTRYLKAAEKAVDSAVLRTIFNTAVTVLLPKVRLVVGASVFVGQGIVNWVLGERDVTDHAYSAAGLFLSGTADISTFGSKTWQITTAAGKSVALTGFMLDVSSVSEAREVRDALQERLNQAQKAYDDLVESLVFAKPQIENLVNALHRWEARLMSDDSDVSISRRDLHKMLQDHNYYP